MIFASTNSEESGRIFARRALENFQVTQNSQNHAVYRVTEPTQTLKLHLKHCFHLFRAALSFFLMMDQAEIFCFNFPPLYPAAIIGGKQDGI